MNGYYNLRQTRGRVGGNSWMGYARGIIGAERAARPRPFGTFRTTAEPDRLARAQQATGGYRTAVARRDVLLDTLRRMNRLYRARRGWW